MKSLGQSSSVLRSLAIPPRNDEIEIIIFGPGKGEALLAHIGNGEWIAVDSCWPSADDCPVTLGYLRLLGVDPSCISHIVVTHWHDDHIAGLSEVVSSCPLARVWATPALQAQELLTLMEHYKKHPQKPFGSGIEEISQVVEVLSRRGAFLRFALEDTSIIHPTQSQGRHEVMCLAPSSLTVAGSLARIAAAMEPVFSQRKLVRLPYTAENDCSIVLRFKVGPHLIVLGGDLEEQYKVGCGWQQALAAHLGHGFGREVQVFKIPHHGSENGYLGAVWQNMLEPDTWALITPYRGGRKSLPAEKGLLNIKRHTNQIYQSAATSTKKVNHPDPTVQRTIRQITFKGLREAYPRNGAVRLRCNISDPSSVGNWRVETFGSAFKVT